MVPKSKFGICHQLGLLLLFSICCGVQIWDCLFPVLVLVWGQGRWPGLACVIVLLRCFCQISNFECPISAVKEKLPQLALTLATLVWPRCCKFLWVVGSDFWNKFAKIEIAPWFLHMPRCEVMSTHLRLSRGPARAWDCQSWTFRTFVSNDSKFIYAFNPFPGPFAGICLTWPVCESSSL